MNKFQFYLGFGLFIWPLLFESIGVKFLGIIILIKWCFIGGICPAPSHWYIITTCDSLPMIGLNYCQVLWCQAMSQGHSDFDNVLLMFFIFHSCNKCCLFNTSFNSHFEVWTKMASVVWIYFEIHFNHKRYMYFVTSVTEFCSWRSNWQWVSIDYDCVLMETCWPSSFVYKDFIPEAGPRLNIKTVLSTYGDFHVKDKTAVRTSYL